MQVGYCQGMNYLAAMLLCIMQQRQEDAFWVLAALIDDGGALLARAGRRVQSFSAVDLRASLRTCGVQTGPPS